jgi:hypothetical protein
VNCFVFVPIGVEEIAEDKTDAPVTFLFILMSHYFQLFDGFFIKGVNARFIHQVWLFHTRFQYLPHFMNSFLH